MFRHTIFSLFTTKIIQIVMRTSISVFPSLQPQISYLDVVVCTAKVVWCTRGSNLIMLCMNYDWKLCQTTLDNINKQLLAQFNSMSLFHTFKYLKRKKLLVERMEIWLNLLAAELITLKRYNSNSHSKLTAHLSRQYILSKVEIFMALKQIRLEDNNLCSLFSLLTAPNHIQCTV